MGIFSRTNIPSSDRRVESLGWSGISNGQALSSRRGWFLWTLGSFCYSVLKLKSRIWKRLASWWFQGFFFLIFTLTWGNDDPIWLYNIFQWVVQPPTRLGFVSFWWFCWRMKMDSMGWTTKKSNQHPFWKKIFGELFLQALSPCKSKKCSEIVVLQILAVATQTFFDFHPGEDSQFWLDHIFQMGWFNHQLRSYWIKVNFYLHFLETIHHPGCFFSKLLVIGGNAHQNAWNSSGLGIIIAFAVVRNILHWELYTYLTKG